MTAVVDEFTLDPSTLRGCPSPPISSPSTTTTTTKIHYAEPRLNTITREPTPGPYLSPHAQHQHQQHQYQNQPQHQHQQHHQPKLQYHQQHHHHQLQSQPSDLPASPQTFDSDLDSARQTPLSAYAAPVLRHGEYHDYQRASPVPLSPNATPNPGPNRRNSNGNETPPPMRLESLTRHGTMKGAGFLPVRKMGITDFFSFEVFQAVLHDPKTAHRFLRFCQTRLCGEHMEFLQMVDTYHRLLDELTHTLSSIHRMHTSPEAPRQINIGHGIMTAISANMKGITTSSIPSLETIFFAAQEHVERLLATDIYPRFVKHQITASAALALADHRERFQGLGDCFVLTDPSIADNPILFASDGFVSVTGYTRKEIIPRNCRFLQGERTEPGAAKRLRFAIDSCEETVELLLNYRKTGEPFWNLLYVAPLLDERGEVAFFLGGQINCNTTIHSYQDVLRVLSINDEDAGMSTGVEDAAVRNVAGSLRGVPGAGQKMKKKGSFFRSWRKAPAAAPTLPKVLVKEEPGMEGALLGRIGRLDFKTQVETFYTAYSKYLLMPSNSVLPIAFYSPSVIDLLCLNLPNGQPAPIVHKDVFKVLGEYSSASSSTIRTLRATVRDALRKSVPVSAEMGLLTGFEEIRAGGGFRWGRSADTADSVHSAGGDVKMRRREERYVSHWTPLKDEEGRVKWVVLVIAPRT